MSTAVRRWLLAISVLLMIVSPALAHAENEPTPTPIVLTAWLNLIGLALSVAGVLFWQTVWRPAQPGDSGEHGQAAQALRHGLLVGWLLIGAAGVLLLLVKAGMDGVSPVVVLTDAAYLSATGVRSGGVWAVRMLLWVALAAVLILGVRQQAARLPRWRVIGVFLLLIAVFGGIQYGTTLYGHTPTFADTVVAMLVETLYTLGLALVIGGIGWYALLESRPYTSHRSAGLRLRAYFTVYMRVAVALPVIAWLGTIWLPINELTALPVTLPGQVLLLYLVALLPVALLAAWNGVTSWRRLRGGDLPWAAAGLHRRLAAELALATVGFAAVGVIALVNPAAQTPGFAEVVTATQPVYLSLRTDPVLADVELHPGWQGINTAYVVLVDTRTGARLDQAQEVAVELTPPETWANLALGQLVNQGDGLYQLDNLWLDPAGEWRIRLTVVRPGETTVVQNDRFTLPPAPTPGDSEPANGDPVRLLPAFLVLAAALVTAGAGGALSLNRGRRLIALGSLIASGGLLLALLLLVNGWRG